MHKTLTGQRRSEAREVLAAYAAATPRRRPPWALVSILAVLAVVGAAGVLRGQPGALPPHPAVAAADPRHTADYAKEAEDNCEAWTLAAAPHARFQYMLRSKVWEDGDGWTIWLPFTSYGDSFMTRCTEHDGQAHAIILRGPN